MPLTRSVQGPIVRTHPNELHIRDIAAYNEIFRIGTPFEKEGRFYGFPFEGSHFSKPDSKSARKRRNLLQPHLSDKSIKKIQPVLERSINQFSRILQNASDDESGVDLSLGYRSITIDMLLRYGFGKTLKTLDDGSFNCRVAEDMDDVLFGSLIAKHFPKVGKAVFELLLRLPRAIAKTVKVSSILEMREECYGMLRQTIEKPRVEDVSHSRIFDTAVKELISDSRQLSIDDLTAEAVVLLFAGGEATAISVIVGTFHLLSDPKRLHILKQELLSAMPDGRILTLSELEKLPYLRGVVKEALRFTQGAPGRLPRVVPSDGATLCGEFIPGQTIVSSSHYVYHFDSHIFDDPFAFKPERWLDETDSQRLDKHMLSFSRGSRGCIGINLAYAELYLIFAHVLRKFDLSLDGTTMDDMTLRDYYAPMAKGHLKVRVYGYDKRVHIDGSE
ncbi:hypothetical protein PENFLA_c046G02007 [Penicillium flavigenum]|uniref:Cytochrome P450 n=1 Tax=Penicillium flavigenum TaxID=254877 RepID=A0A1V6SHN1_9EURO|nr:hypothetical protein PENFLA_c046G02007 [Penicillium flavigenum]